jgi:zinc D-Ala-D-Ala carboxypeptidase
MIDSRKNLFLAALACVALFVMAAAAAWPGYGQGVKRNAKPRTGPSAGASTQGTVKKTGRASSSSAANDAMWIAAGQQNGQLRDEIEWVFGGKQQRGWAIYVPLIAHTLETDAATESSDFAQAVARWQRGAGLPANGTLGSATLYELIAKWQSRRLKGNTYPSPDQLVTAPASDFYDPGRAAEQRQVEKETYAAYKRMVAAAAADPALGLKKTAGGELAPGEKYLKIISAFRSREHQERLRREDPQAGRAQLAVNSPHFTGRALDLYVGGEPVSSKDANRALQTQTRAYRWLVRNAARFGFQPYYYEPWHWEYTGQ